MPDVHVEYDDGIEDTPLNRKHRPAEPPTVRRNRTRGFYVQFGDWHKVPIGFMRVSEMKGLEDLCQMMITESLLRADVMPSSCRTTDSKNTLRPSDPGSSAAPSTEADGSTKFFRTVKRFLGRLFLTRAK